MLSVFEWMPAGQAGLVTARCGIISPFLKPADSRNKTTVLAPQELRLDIDLVVLDPPCDLDRLPALPHGRWGGCGAGRLG